MLKDISYVCAIIMGSQLDHDGPLASVLWPWTVSEWPRSLSGSNHDIGGVQEKRHKKIYVECVGSVVTVDRSVKRKEVCLIGLSHALLNYILKLIVLVLLILGILLRNIPCVGVFLCGFISCVQRYSFVLFTASTECMD